MLKHCRAGAGRLPRGLSLVELLVGVVVGLFIVGGASYFAVNFNAENRRLLLEARLTQDMRAAMDIVTRDVRRAGYWQNATSGVSIYSTNSPTVPYSGTGFAAITPTSGASASAITYAYDKSASAAVTTADQAGFGLIGGVLTTTIGNSGPQPLTDASTTVVTVFDVTAGSAVESVVCNASSAVPTVAIRHLTIKMTARSAIDSSIVRTLTNQVRVRNDLTSGAC
jgi:prepilin peptidase dependent protein B